MLTRHSSVIVRLAFDLKLVFFLVKPVVCFPNLYAEWLFIWKIDGATNVTDALHIKKSIFILLESSFLMMQVFNIFLKKLKLKRKL